MTAMKTLVLFARSDDMGNDRYDFQRGCSVHEKFVPTEWAQQHGITVYPMPVEMVIYAKTDKKTGEETQRTFGDLSVPFVLALLDNGNVVNEFRGSDFERIIPISKPEFLLQLKTVFGASATATPEHDEPTTPAKSETGRRTKPSAVAMPN